ncbi:dTDP-4-dehydrorhamnose 3,5-epimerase [Deinococcus indicus]|uniref:dTDP-4-dehydrorhamnose 3,5-epimerase n=1 Tax=Deinococcus indicus TaxID=223556 RepID=A0A246BHQ2_9DEIO|nr:dTDP-4-dehydrorhamnose 3,5-epimerase [Deinococcus indicus]OWL94796.1 dTDP-4-dehydrorhamnose 3,5-epimerase [Deinococcus indicus]
MNLTETALSGAFIIDLTVIADERGGFARTFDRDVFAGRGLNPLTVQANLSFNHRAGTLRGLHYQLPPAAETKLVRCTRGAILDVIVDLRPQSPTYLQHVAVELTADNRRALFVPEQFAHGYQALTDGAEVTYQVSAAYTPGSERGLRFDDPALGIGWPLPVTVISSKDAAWPLLADRDDLPRPVPAPPAALEVSR